MSIFLDQRDTEAREHMDDPDCNREQLFDTYRQFSYINALISGWKRIYRREIRPVCAAHSKPYRLLDIGFGGGDLPIKIAQWAKSDKLQLQITAIDSDPRALEFVEQHHTELPEHITFRNISSGELLESGARFDFVISNHLLHHLPEDTLAGMLYEATALSRQKVIFNDIERSAIGYLLFSLLSRPFFRNSFITEDGLTSIRRSYTASELRAVLPEGWNIERIFPYRLLVTYKHAYK